MMSGAICGTTRYRPIIIGVKKRLQHIGNIEPRQIVTGRFVKPLRFASCQQMQINIF